MNMLDKLDYVCKKNKISIKNDGTLHTNLEITHEYRLILELYYALSVSKAKHDKYDNLIEKAIEELYLSFEAQGVITKELVNKIEKLLAPMTDDAKSYTLICIGHAHIDMNWMWGFNETVSITHDTFRTVLDLMEMYPDFTYAQSQASVYKIMEEYFPEMIDEVKLRIKEGRWEVAASTWVEADRNMPNAESVARHLLYTKKYLSQLLDIDPNSLNFDFEPDTFGHNANTPEILSKGGVKYYYHCRGYKDEILYRWHSPSGEALTVFCEPTWYNHTVTGHSATILAEFCKKYDMDSMLCVYGVGDHGGGPTKRDIERIIEMNNWPIFSNWKFGTYAEFFKKTDKIVDKLPKANGELNYIFTGCYTSQSIIKKNNKRTELALKNTEMWNTIAHNALETSCDNFDYEKNWRKVLFNQFHDILPGSGVTETREYASGLAQEVFSFTDITISKCLREISDNTNTIDLIDASNSKDTISQGAGVGYGIGAKIGAQYSRHSGIERLFTVFNSLPYDRHELVEITLWDWQGDLDRILFTDAYGNELGHQAVDSGIDSYWGHYFATLLVEVDVRSTGYTTIISKQRSTTDIVKPIFFQPRVLKHQDYALENEYIKVELDDKAKIISLIDKQTNVEYVKDRPIGIFKYISEDSSKGMSSWCIGDYMREEVLNDRAKITKVNVGAEKLRQTVVYSIDFGSSSNLEVTVILDKKSKKLIFDIECRWQEIGSKETCIPQLQFSVPIDYKCNDYAYDIPAGLINRKPLNHDVPAMSFALANNMEGKSIATMSDCKYGYRGNEGGLVVNLIRSSFDPDPYPEIRVHKFLTAIAIVENAHKAKFLSNELCEPLMSVSAKSHKGNLPTTGSFLEVLSGDIIVSSYKASENNSHEMVLRLYGLNESITDIKIRMQKEIKSAQFADINEEPIAGKVDFDERILTFSLAQNQLCTILIAYKD